MSVETYHTPSRLLDSRVRVCLVGAGGTGSEMLDGLVKLHRAIVHLGHPGGLHVTLYDDDTVSQSNTVRQRYFEGDEGQNKALLSIHRINMFYGLDWTAKAERFGAGDLSNNQFDLLITCVDLARVRSEIGRRGREKHARNLLWLDTGNGRTDGQIVLGDYAHVAVGKFRLPNVVDLFPELLDDWAVVGLDADDEPSCSVEAALDKQDLFVNRTIATAACQMLYDLLRKGKLDYHGAFVNVARATTAPLRIDRNVWAAMGYAEQGKSESMEVA